MYGLIREAGSFGANPGAKDLAKHLYTRIFSAPVVIVADKPITTLGQLRKQWFKLYRRVKREQASTLDPGRLKEYTHILSRMLAMRFTTKWPDDSPAHVYIASAEQLLRWAPECRTLYVTCDIELEDLHRITSFMPRGSLVVMCQLSQSK